MANEKSTNHLIKQMKDAIVKKVVGGNRPSERFCLQTSIRAYCLWSKRLPVETSPIMAAIC